MPDDMSTSPPVREELDQDTKDLHAMGYAQELDRSMSKFSNFAVSFTIISILSGCLTLYGYGLLHGGPPVMLWGWLLVGVLVLFAGMSLGEICSAFPTAGGLYYWAAKLAPGNSAPDLVLVHRLVQPARPGRRHRRHQLRLRLLHLGVPVHPDRRARRGSSRTPRSSSSPSCSVIQGLLNTFSVAPRRPAQRRVGVLAPHRRGDHLRAALLGAVVGQPPVRQLPLRQLRAGTRSRASPASRSRCTSSSSAS